MNRIDEAAYEWFRDDRRFTCDSEKGFKSGAHWFADQMLAAIEGTKTPGFKMQTCCARSYIEGGESLRTELLAMIEEMKK